MNILKLAKRLVESKTIILLCLFVILVLDWAALDDITTGSEPSLLGEWLMIIVSIPLLLASGYLLFRRRKQ